MSKVPDAWDDEWTTKADTTPSAVPEQSAPKKLTAKASKAQRRAEQAEFNRQIWAEAEGPKETNHYLESRNVVPLSTEFKPAPILLSRKGPPIVKSKKPPTDALNALDLDKRAQSSEDEDEIQARENSLAERQAQAAKDREEKQRKYAERRQELFGSSNAAGANRSTTNQQSQSGASTPSSITPPGSRSATPNRGRGRGRGRGNNNPGQHSQGRPQQQKQPELYDPGYKPRPDSSYIQRRESPLNITRQNDQQRPVRTPRGPDGSGRGGHGFTLTRPSASGQTTPTMTVEQP